MINTPDIRPVTRLEQTEKAIMPARYFVLEPFSNPNTDIVGTLAKMDVVPTYLFDSNYVHSSVFDESFSHEIDKKLKDFQYNPDVDYIVLSGNALSVNHLVAVIGVDYGTFKALAFNAKNLAYQEVMLG